jgi:hypothetical protein
MVLNRQAVDLIKSRIDEELCSTQEGAPARLRLVILLGRVEVPLGGGDVSQGLMELVSLLI